MAFSSVPARLGPFVVRNVLCTTGAGAMLRVEDIYGGKTQTVMLLDPDLPAWPARLRDRHVLPSHPRLCSLSQGAPAVAEHDNRTFYYVGAESLSGWTVLDEIARDGAIQPLLRALRLCAEAAEALACAHAAGLYHGHLEPGCLFVQTYAEEDEGHIKLLGAGLDVIASPSSRAALYRELNKGQAPCPRTVDLYALAAVLHHMVLSHPPGGGGELPAAAAEIPQELVALLARALSPEPRARYSTATALCEALLDVEAAILRDSTPEMTLAMRFCADTALA